MKLAYTFVAFVISLALAMPATSASRVLMPGEFQSGTEPRAKGNCLPIERDVTVVHFKTIDTICTPWNIGYGTATDIYLSFRSSPPRTTLAKSDNKWTLGDGSTASGKPEPQFANYPSPVSDFDRQTANDEPLLKSAKPATGRIASGETKRLRIARTGEPDTLMKLLKAFEAMGSGKPDDGSAEDEDANDHLSALSDAQVCSRIADHAGADEETNVRFWQEPSVLLNEGRKRGLTNEICKELVKLDDTQGGTRSSTSISDEAVELLSSRITKETKAYRFKVQGLEPVESNEISKGLAGGYPETRIQFEFPDRPGQAGYLFFAGSDHVLCELKRNVATWCVDGLGLVQNDTKCKKGWEFTIRKDDKYNRIRFPGTILYCEVQTLRGTGMSANGVALFHYDIDKGLTYLGYIPTNEYIFGAIVHWSLFAGFETEISLVSNSKAALRFSVCPTIEVSSQEDDGKPNRSQKLPCAIYNIAGSTPSLKFQGPAAAKPLNNDLLMGVFEAEASRLGKN